ncbi:LysR family transcriptional regulator [Streptomyces sp. NPDC000151]|uniref:LysR family transcriptional regulator n=1 Tax=Streptomyces sp. NPDC000151 TaxID=3154244 RepID=UPI0033227149
MERSVEHGAPGDPLAQLCPDLTRFAAVGRLEHLSAAADELRTPQSTVSRSVVRVEEAVGVRLFGREGRGMRLTRQGRAFLARVERGLEEIGAGYEELRADTDAPGMVALGFLPALGTAPVPLLVRWFRALHPGVRFRLVQDHPEGLLERLRAGEVDLCLTSPLIEEPGVSHRAVTHEPLRLVVPAGHRLATRRRVDIAEAAGEDFVMAAYGYGLRRLVNDLCGAAGFTPRVAFEGAEVATIRGLVAAGLGVSVLPSSPAVLPGVVQLPLTDADAYRTVGLTWITDRPRTPLVTAFTDLVTGRAQEAFGTTFDD